MLTTCTHSPCRYDPTNPLTPAELDVWVSKYADLLQRTDQAVRRHTTGVMIWASTDHNWATPHQNPGDVLHAGTRPFLDALWPKIGIALDWGVAVHPYDDGNPRDNLTADGVYTFDTLNSVVAYQTSQLQAVTLVPSTGLAGRPQAILYASEQGWFSSPTMTPTLQGRNVCYAHDLSLSLGSHMFGVTHNFFQDNPNGGTQAGMDFGLLPYTIAGNLSNADGYPTYEAYKSTSPRVWAHRSDHWCCTQYQVGCAQ